VLVDVGRRITGCLGRDAHIGERAERTALLLRRQPLENGSKSATTNLVDFLDRFTAAVSGANRDDTPVVGIAPPLHESALDHAIDDARHVGERHVEHLGEPAHGQWPFTFQQEQDVQMRVAYCPQAPVASDGPTLTRDQRLELLEDALDEVRALGLSGCFGWYE